MLYRSFSYPKLALSGHAYSMGPKTEAKDNTTKNGQAAESHGEAKFQFEPRKYKLKSSLH